MSKMSQLHAELSAQAYDLGFNSLEDAINMGYEVDYTEGRLVSPEDSAHEFLLKEKEKILKQIKEAVRTKDIDVAVKETLMDAYLLIQTEIK